MNRYQGVFSVAGAFLLFIGIRSYSPYPNYPIPRTQLTGDEPLPQPDVSVEDILRLKPFWSDKNRDTFQKHQTFIPKIISRVAEEPPPPPAPEVPPEPEPEKIELIVLAPPKPPVPEQIDPGLTEPKEIKPKRPPKPLIVPEAPVQKSKGRPTLGLKPPTSKPPTSKPPTSRPSEPPAEPEKPYELPFQFQGIVRPGGEISAMVILRNKKTGGVIRRHEGQKFQGVHFRKISPSSVEIEIPSEGLHLRYSDSKHAWIPF